MPVSVRLDKLTIPCNFGEPILPPDSDYWNEFATHYPFPRFRELGHLVERNIQVVILENALVEYTFLPEFGGRLVGIRDKRSGKCPLQLPAQIMLEKGEWDCGATFGALGLSGFAPDATLFELGHEEESEEAASVVFYTTSPILEVSSQVRISLSSDSPWLEIECSTLNRSLSACHVETGIRIGCPDRGTVRFANDWLCVSPERNDCWLALRFLDGDFSEIRRNENSINLLRLNSSNSLAGAMNDCWNFSLVPLTGISKVDCLTEEFGIGIEEDKLTIVSHFPKPKCQIQLTSTKQESFQSTATLYPEQPFQASLQGVGELSSIAISHSGSNFHHSFEHRTITSVDSALSAKLRPEEDFVWKGSRAVLDAVELLNLDMDPSSRARAAGIHVGDRTIANAILAIHACRNSDWDASLAHLDQALSHEASNGLLWWMRAVINRQRGETEDQPDRLNAHFLLPLEPALRAEAFLSQPAVTSMDPIPLVAPVALHDRAAAEIAGMYWNMGLFRDVVRWVDECCRHRESSWLRIVHAGAFMKLKGKEMESHTQLQFAERAGIGPPYPATELEFRILDELRCRFPGIEILDQWAEMVQKVR